MLMRYITLTLILFFTWTFLLSASASTTLKGINKDIDTIKSQIQQQQRQQQQLEKKLKTIEVKSGHLSLEIDQTQGQLHQQKTQLYQLTTQKEALNKTLNEKKRTFQQNISNIYILSQQPALKLLLNQEKAATLSHQLMYYHYLLRDQQNIISSLSQTIETINNTQTQLEAHYSSLKILHHKQTQQHQQYNQLNNQRQQVLNTINHQLSSKKQKLHSLTQHKQALENTLQKLKNNHKVNKKTTKPFSLLKGHLKWPVKGQISENFDTQIMKSELKLNGVLIKAKEGTPIHAIAQGTVVFAKWLPGYGLMLIISHENGYMSLYGRNQSIYKKEGDTVMPGDLIATVGQSGGNITSGLYFAIRHDAKPLNPSHWCS